MIALNKDILMIKVSKRSKKRTIELVVTLFVVAVDDIVKEGGIILLHPIVQLLMVLVHPLIIFHTGEGVHSMVSV